MIEIQAEPIDKDIEVITSESLSPKGRSLILADEAKKELALDLAIDIAIIGRNILYKVIVDGVLGRKEEDVRPDGEIDYEFELLNDVLSFIDKTLIENSPVKSGLYASSHRLYADGTEIDPNSDTTIPAAEYVFLNIQPYARKIEQGESPQFPDGVYQATASLAASRFGNIASITFTYRSASGVSTRNRQDRQPAIIVRSYGQ